jgi:hypothetical protein
VFYNDVFEGLNMMILVGLLIQVMMVLKTYFQINSS